MTHHLDRRCQLCSHPAWLHQPTGCKGAHPGANRFRFTPCQCQKYEAAG